MINEKNIIAPNRKLLADLLKISEIEYFLQEFLPRKVKKIGKIIPKIIIIIHPLLVVKIFRQRILIPTNKAINDDIIIKTRKIKIFLSIIHPPKFLYLVRN